MSSDHNTEAEKIADQLSYIITYSPDYLPYSEIICGAENFLRSLNQAPAIETLEAFVASLTDNGNNRNGMLSIDHDALVSLIKKADAAIVHAKGPIA